MICRYSGKKHVMHVGRVMTPALRRDDGFSLVLVGVVLLYLQQA